MLVFRILWFDKNDVKEGNVVTYRFTRHPWGVKSSPFIASFTIKKTLDDNTTGASDLTLDTIHKNIYMDDLMFSVDSLNEAKIIANEAIDLFDSRGFKLVKWSANKNAIPVLTKFEKDVLISGMRELDLSLEHDNDLPETKPLGCVWETGGDCLRIVSSLKPLTKYTCRTMLSQLGKPLILLEFYPPFC